MAYGVYDYENSYGGTSPYGSTYGGSSAPSQGFSNENVNKMGNAGGTSYTSGNASGTAQVSDKASGTGSEGSGASSGPNWGAIGSQMASGGGGWGAVTNSFVSHLMQTINNFERAEQQKRLLAAMTAREAPFTKESVQGIADLSATINDLRHGTLGQRNEQRVGADIARRMGARGVGGAAAQLAAQNSIEAARDNYNQWRLDKLRDYITTRQGLSGELQKRALAERVARLGVEEAERAKGWGIGKFIGRNLGGFGGSLAGMYTGGDMASGAMGGADTGEGIVGLIQMLSQWGQDYNNPYRGGWAPDDWASYYDKYYAAGGK